MKSGHKAVLAAVLAALTGVCAPAHAQDVPAPAHTGLNLNGAVGMPLNATANIPAVGSFRVQGDYFDMGDAESTTFDDTQFRFYGFHAAGRIGRAPIEISGGYEKLDVDADDDPDMGNADNSGLAIGAKWQFWRNRDGNTFAAVGAGYSRVLAKNFHAYVVGTKTFDVGRRGVTGHLGLRYDRFNVDEITDEDTSSKVSIYGGVEVPIDRNGDWALVGELQSKNNEFDEGLFGDITTGEAKALYSASVRFQRNGWAAQAGIARRGYPGATNDSGLFAQVGKTF